MRTYLDCFPCVLRQTLEAAREATDDEAKQRELLNRVMELLISLRLEVSPPEIGQVVHRLIRERTGVRDPYAEKKRHYNERATALLPRVRELIENSEDPLRTAVRLAIAGNVIDFGVQSSGFDLEGEIERALETPFGIDHYDRFVEDVRKAGTLVYLGDNAGEIAFDRLLVEVLQRLSPAEITFVVRGEPVLNDATLEDARAVGLTEVVRVLDNGSDAPATVLSEVRPDVRRLIENADVVIAKGQGNYETLSTAPLNIYFLFKVKCPVIGRDAGVDVGKYVLASARVLQEKKGETA